MSTEIVYLMKLTADELPREKVACSNCAANCCRLEVLILTDTGVPDDFIQFDQWGGQTMLRLDDGWCAALDRNSMKCSIYQNRPLICRDFEVASDECLVERGISA